ncbi:hypothetical protein DFQ28_002929 [Apophysomyces sp. BC1034]|nr:hypothetical protein DFQ30_009678 [Apophysomyces sp. BC1015]KAG0180655.1 hypothetical protein DFQ29_000215 [Apophysomyces sp. BC1021]KAG0194854.1 hypothetical protein DFQ28_002929 [Apophysomyces sp. BC1034]
MRKRTNLYLSFIIPGAILGDSLGLATEGMTKKEVEQAYGQGPIRFGMDDDQNEHVPFLRDSYRAMFEDNDFSDDSEQQLLVLQSIAENGGVFNYKDFAARLKDYGINGISGLNKQPVGLSSTTKAVVERPDFLANPHQAAAEVWKSKNSLRGANGALVRSAVLGIPKFWDGTTVIENTTDSCRVTHPDPRCMISCVIVSTLVARMLRGQDLEMEDSRNSSPVPSPISSTPPLQLPTTLPTNEVFIDTLETDVTLMTLVRAVIETNKRILTAPNTDPLFRSPETDVEQTKMYYQQLLEHLFVDPFTLDRLQLDQDDCKHTFKCLSASIYAFTREIPPGRETDYFKGIMMDLVMQGGEADTNASVAGALLGVRIGYSELPSEWVVGLRRWEWLEDLIEDFCKLL